MTKVLIEVAEKPYKHGKSVLQGVDFIKSKEPKMTHNKPIANPLVILREEFDDWAILFDPDANAGYAVDPVSVFIWKRLDGAHTPEDILEGLRKNFKDVPEDADTHIKEFVDDLVKHGLVGYESQ